MSTEQTEQKPTSNRSKALSVIIMFCMLPVVWFCGKSITSVPDTYGPSGEFTLMIKALTEKRAEIDRKFFELTRPVLSTYIKLDPMPGMPLPYEAQWAQKEFQVDNKDRRIIGAQIISEHNTFTDKLDYWLYITHAYREKEEKRPNPLPILSIER